MKNFAFAFVLVIITSIRVCGQAGTLDISFDFNGISAPDSTNVGTGMALQTDGKIVLVGCQTYPTPTSHYDFAIKRLLSDGSLDSSFSSDGIDVLDLDTSAIIDDNVPNAVKIQSNGKILVAGFTGLPASRNLGVVRYHANGTLDNSFGTNGIVIYDLSGINSRDEVFDMTIDANGKILLGGYANATPVNSNFALCRLNVDGSLDTSFGIGGIVLNDISGQNDIINSIIELQDGRIAVCGSSNDNSIIAIYLNNGQLDTSFSGDGMVITAFHNINPDQANSIVQQGDGKLVICGNVDTIGAGDFIVARYLLDGNLDPTFSTDGYDRKDMGGNYDVANDLIIQPDNYIVLGGHAYYTNNRNFALTRYNFNGEVDSSFGTNGIIITTTEYASSIADLAIQPDLKLLAGGHSGDIGTGAYVVSMAVARYDIGLYIGIPEFGIDNDVLLYPNPVVENAMIRYSLLTEELLNVNLQNIQGQIVKTYLNHEHQSSGDHELNIELPVDLPSGIYFITLSTSSGSVVVKIVH